MATHEFLLPDVGEGLEAGTIVQWLVNPGDAVKTDQIIVEIETDKAVVEIPAPVTGTLTRCGGDAGATLPVGAVLATFDAESSGAAPVADHQPAGNKATTAAATLATTAIQPSTRVLASPATRKYARNNGVDLSLISGSGSRGQITRSDVERYLNNPALGTPAFTTQSTAPHATTDLLSDPAGQAKGTRPVRKTEQLAGSTEALSGLRKQIASNMQSAWRDIPHIFTFEEINAENLIAARRDINSELETQSQRISFLPFFVKACVLALQEHPRFNASLNMRDETVTYHGNCNVGIATATPQGLIVTVVHQAEQKPLIEIGMEIAQLASLARERRVKVEQIKGGTFTISNFGSYGGTIGTPIIRPPEVAIAGFGRIHEKVVAVNGEPAVRQILPIAISTDHRLNDGEHLGGFVATLTRLLSNPVRMLGHF